ncbi:hypothetical protein K432DRAFT_287162, partial [Lepidopterella palustris CBS 459.81]
QNFNIPIQVQPQCFGLLTLVCWGQTLVYHDGWRTWTASLATAMLAIGFGAVEAILVLTLRGPYNRGVSWPLTMIAILASVILAVGLIPPYFELAKRGGRVIGINFIFLTVDWLGAFFSLMALAAQNTFDYLGGTLYIVCVLLEIGIFISQFIWLYRTRHIRRAAKKMGKTYDEYMADTTPPSDRQRPDTARTVETLDAYNGESYETIYETIAALEKCKTKDVKSPKNENLDLEMGIQGVKVTEKGMVARSAGRVY